MSNLPNIVITVIALALAYGAAGRRDTHRLAFWLYVHAVAMSSIWLRMAGVI